MFIILIHSFSFLTISFLTVVLNSSPVISVRKARKSTIRINILDEAVSAPRDDEGWRMLTTYDSAICPSLMMGFFFFIILFLYLPFLVFDFVLSQPIITLLCSC